MYILHPPIFTVPEKGDFADAWESFCRKMLNIENQTDEIYVRAAPEKGIDLYWPAKKIAFQCKSVVSGKSGDFNVTKVVKSHEAAKKAKDDGEVEWDRYVLCTNIAITGNSEKTLRECIPGIEIYQESYWHQLCEKYSSYVVRNFRRILEIPQQRLSDIFEKGFASQYSDEMLQKLKVDPFDIFLYSNRHDKVYRLTVSDEFLIRDLLNVLRASFKLPESTKFEDENVRASLSHSVVFNGKKQPLSQSLSESGIIQGSFVTYWTTVVWKDLKNMESFDGNVFHKVTMNHAMNFSRTFEERIKSAGTIFDEKITDAFQRFDEMLYSGVGGE